MRRQKILFAFAILVSALVGFDGGLAPVQSDAASVQPLTVETVWRHDFEDGTVGGWSAYPAAQDAAGGDPSVIPGRFWSRYALQGYAKADEAFYPLELAPPPTPEPNQYYLLRVSRPNSGSSQRFGVSHRTWLRAGPGFRLAFSYWLKNSSTPERLRIDLAGSDGKRYTARVDRPDLERWKRVELPLDAFRVDGASLATGLGIEFVAIIAEFAHGDPSAYVFLAIDNVELHARVQAGFDVQEPRADRYPEWPIQIAQRHVRPGQDLNLRVRASVGLREVTGRLEGFAGNAIAGPFALRRSAGATDEWSAENAYRFSESTPYGPLTLTLEGQDAQGRVARSDVRLWHLPPVSRNLHPRVFVTPADHQRLTMKIRSGIGAKALAAMVKSAAAARRTEVPTEYPIEEHFQQYRTPGRETWFRVFRGTARDIEVNAWVYFLTGDREAGQWARTSLLKMMRWKQWVLPWFQWVGRETYYPVGIAAQEVGLTYDLIFPLLSAEDGALVREATLQKAIVPSWKEYFVANDVPANTSNHISHNTAGPLVAAIALYGDFAGDDDQARLELAFSGLAEKFLAFSKATMREDGSYGEGYGYQNFTYSTASLALAALDHAFGVKGLAADLHYLKGHVFPLYASTKRARWKLSMGDSHDDRGAASNWVWFARQSDDPIARWFYAQAPGTDWKDLLWAEDDWTLEPPDGLPPSRVFPEKGNVVFRSGWGDDDTVFVMRAGPNYNHNHLDQGNFRLRAYGEDLVAEAGRGSYEFDPYFRSYVIQAAGHNVILVDDNPESQEIGDTRGDISALADVARIEHYLLSPSVSFVQTELSPVYRDDVERFTRSVYFVTPGYVFIRDRIRSTRPHRYHWQLFPPDRNSVKVGERSAQFVTPRATLRVDVVLPRRHRLQVKNAPMSVDDYDKFPASPLRPKGILQVVNVEPANEEEFLVALTPARAGAAAGGRVEEIPSTGFVTLRIVYPERSDSLYFAREQPIRGDVATDGAFAFVSREGSRVVSAAVQQGKRLEVEGRPLLVAARSVNAAVLRRDGREVWTFQCDEATEATIRTAAGSARTVRIAAGYSVITLEP